MGLSMAPSSWGTLDFAIHLHPFGGLRLSFAERTPRSDAEAASGSSGHGVGGAPRRWLLTSDRKGAVCQGILGLELFANLWVCRIKPLKLKLLAGEQVSQPSSVAAKFLFDFPAECV